MINNIKDRLLKVRLQRDENEIKIGFVIIVILLANIAYLNYAFLGYNSNNSVTKQPEQTSNPILPSPQPTAGHPQDETPSAIIPTQAVQTIPATSTTNHVGADYYIPLGTGTNQATTWTGIVGAQATVNFGSYPNISQVLFEASVTTPTSNQKVSVQLYNITDQHPVWNSQVSTNGQQSAFLASSPLIYDTGEKVYQVQMQNQLAATANLTQARIHIILQQ